MKVNVIGTSCTWFKRNDTSFILDDKYVFDTPEGSYKDIIKVVDALKIKSFFITHFHCDHFGDFHIFAAYIMRLLPEGSEKVKVYGPKGTLDTLIAYNTLMKGADDECSKEALTKNMEFIELYDGKVFNDGKYEITTYLMEHGKPETFGFTFKDNETGTVYGFSADTKMCDNLIKIIERSNYGFIEMAASTPSQTHISIDEFIELSKKYPSTKMYPVHTNDYSQEYAENNGLNALYDGQVLNLE